MKPSLLARTVYQVGSPAIFDGNMFLPDTGMPIWKSERRMTRLAVWLPDPLTVATWIVKSLTTLVIVPWLFFGIQHSAFSLYARSNSFAAAPISAGLFTTRTPAA